MPGVNVEALRQVSAALGSAVAAPSQWPSILDRICEAMNCKGAALLPRIGDSFPTSASMIEPFALYMKEEWYKHDLRRRGIAVQLRGTAVVVDDDISTEEERLKSPHHSEFLPRIGLKWWAGTAVWAGHELWCLALQRSVEEGQFSNFEKSVLADFSPRLTEVATLSRAIGHANVAAVTNALDHVQQPALAVDDNGRVVNSNASASALLDDAVWISHGQLVLEDKQAAFELRNQLLKLLFLSDGQALRAPPIIVRRTNSCPLTMKVLPIDGEARSLFAAARAIILLKEVRKPRPPQWQLLQKTYNLTPAQARLAAQLATGESLEHSAEVLSITKETPATS